MSYVDMNISTNEIIYKNHKAIYKYNPEDEQFHGKVLTVNYTLHFSGDSVNSLLKEFQRVIDALEEE
jgi:predicted HicB family RNase H-like nuclease